MNFSISISLFDQSGKESGIPEIELNGLPGLERMTSDILARYPGISWEEINFDTSREIYHNGRPGWQFKGDKWQRSFRASVRSLSTNSIKPLQGSLVYRKKGLNSWELDYILID